MKAVDLFAGPGGWDIGARRLGIEPLGIELDAAACSVRTHIAAGHRTLQADVAQLDPLDFPCELLIASPPCTAFSMAGKGAGRDAMEELLAGVEAMDYFHLHAEGDEDTGGATDRPPIPHLDIDDEAAGRDGYGDRAGTNAIRVTEAEAAILQSFPPGYPWAAAGTKSAAFRCIGNAVPPLLAQAVLKAVVQ